MTFDTSNTGDDWDSYVPAPAQGAAPVYEAAPPPHTMYTSAPSRSSGGGGGGSAGILRRFIGLPIIGVLAIGGFIANAGTTSALDVGVGDCFNVPENELAFERLDTEPCSEPHNAQVYASVGQPAPEAYPSDFDSYWERVFNSCEQATAVLTRFDAVPDDSEFTFYKPDRIAWNSGERESICFLYSPSGLNGSHVAGAS